jgi:hypothetical protein
VYSPRYRVKTLLIATTLAAVVLACLAPWLRTLTQLQLIGILGRVVFVALGCWGDTQLSLYTYNRYARRERAAELGITSRCLKVRPAPLVWFLAAFILAVAIFVEVGMDTMDSSLIRRPYRWMPFALELLSWWTVGIGVSRCMVPWFGVQRPVYLTCKRLITPWICHPWTRGFECGWRDRAAGQLLFIVPLSYRLELSIPPENVELVERMLNPTENRPPVVPPPPAT